MMTGSYSNTQIRDITQRFADRLAPQDLKDVSEALMLTCQRLAREGHCSPHWLDLVQVGTQLGLMALQMPKQ